MTQKKTAAVPVTRDDFTRLRAGSKRRAWIGVSLLVLGLAMLIFGRYSLLQFVVDEKAAGRPATIVEMYQERGGSLFLFWGGLITAFAGTMTAALSWMHARHVAQGLKEFERAT